MTNQQKIIDILTSENRKNDGRPHVSLEYFPPRSREGVEVCMYVCIGTSLSVDLSLSLIGTSSSSSTTTNITRT